MNSLTLILSPEQIATLGATYASYTQSPPPHATLRLKVDGLSVTAYKSGKILFQGKGIEDFIQKNHLEQSIDATSKKALEDSTLPEGFATSSLPITLQVAKPSRRLYSSRRLCDLERYRKR